MSEQIRWGILSTANIAVKRFIPGAARSRNGVVAAIASRDLHHARDVADSLGISLAYGSYQELLEDPEIDEIRTAAGALDFSRKGVADRSRLAA